MLRRMICLCIALFALPALAAQTAAERALRQILHAERVTDVSYKVHEDGFIHIVFSGRMMDEDYERILERLNRHPDIPGVLAVREADVFCRP